MLINTEMPSILAEVGFISNPEEEKLLRKESYRQSIAEALYQGVKNYVDAAVAADDGNMNSDANRYGSACDHAQARYNTNERNVMNAT